MSSTYTLWFTEVVNSAGESSLTLLKSLIRAPKINIMKGRALEYDLAGLHAKVVQDFNTAPTITAERMATAIIPTSRPEACRHID